MARAVGVKVFTSFDGLEAIERTAKRRAITLKAIKAGAKLVQARAKTKVVKRSGALRQSIGIKAEKGRKGKTLALAVVGARVKVVRQYKGKSIRPAKYAHLVEKGTSRAAAKPFLKPSLDGQKTAVSKAVLDTLAAEIQKELAKAAARAKVAVKRGK